MPGKELTVKGLSGILETLQKLPPEIVSRRGGPVRESMFAGAKIYRDEIKRKIPQVLKHPDLATGALRGSVIATRGRVPAGFKGERYVIWLGKPKVKVYVKKSKTGKAGKLYFTPGAQYYGRFVEYGRDQKTRFGKKRVSPTPYLRPVFTAQSQRVIEKVRYELNRRVTKLAQIHLDKNKNKP